MKKKTCQLSTFLYFNPNLSILWCIENHFKYSEGFVLFVLKNRNLIFILAKQKKRNTFELAMFTFEVLKEAELLCVKCEP